MSGNGEPNIPFSKDNVLPNDNTTGVGNTIFENKIQLGGQVGGKKSKTTKKRNAKKSAKKSTKKSNKKTAKKCKKLFWFF